MITILINEQHQLNEFTMNTLKWLSNIISNHKDRYNNFTYTPVRLDDKIYYDLNVEKIVYSIYFAYHWKLVLLLYKYNGNYS